MGDAPSLRDIVLEQFRQCFGRRACGAVSPGTERYQQVSFFVKCHIAMHHRAKSHGSYFRKCHAVFFLYICRQILVTVL